MTYMELFTPCVSYLQNVPRTLHFVCQCTRVAYPRVLSLRALPRLRLDIARRLLTSVANQDDGDKADEREKKTAQERSPHHLVRDPHLLPEQHAIHSYNKVYIFQLRLVYKFRTLQKTRTTWHVRKRCLIRGSSQTFPPLSSCTIRMWVRIVRHMLRPGAVLELVGYLSRLKTSLNFAVFCPELVQKYFVHVENCGFSWVQMNDIPMQATTYHMHPIQIFCFGCRCERKVVKIACLRLKLLTISNVSDTLK